MNGGLAGAASVGCSAVAVLTPWPDSQVRISLTLLVVSGAPLLGIVFAYGLCSLVAEERDSTANRLAFVPREGVANGSLPGGKPENLARRQLRTPLLRFGGQLAAAAREDLGLTPMDPRPEKNAPRRR